MADIGYKMCLFPVTAELQEFGKPKIDPEGSLKLPCGKCSECISKRAVEWATRCRHEISLHKENCFITLTYDDENLPSHTLVKEDFQKFMKRLRKHTKKKIRYIMSGEYGSKTYRPHFHSIIFGWSPSNQKLNRYAPSGEPLFTSPILEKLWPYGYHSIGTANEKTAFYIASYALKGKKHTLPDPITGELIQVSDYMQCSKRPAIGLDYFNKNKQQLIDSRENIPRYYQKKLKENHLDLFEQYENNTQNKITNRGSHQLLAKYVLDKRKINSSSEFRPAPENKEDIYYKRYLTTNRNLTAESETKNERKNL